MSRRNFVGGAWRGGDLNLRPIARRPLFSGDLDLVGGAFRSGD